MIEIGFEKMQIKYLIYYTLKVFHITQWWDFSSRYLFDIQISISCNVIYEKMDF